MGTRTGHVAGAIDKVDVDQLSALRCEREHDDILIVGGTCDDPVRAHRFSAALWRMIDAITENASAVVG
jgi:hypothetical protein